MAAHTTGPWTVDGRTPTNDGWCLLLGQNGYGIGCVWDRNGKPENVANARLIAAAPELLAALKDVTAQLERVLNLMGLHHDEFGEIALYRGKDALALAEGTSSTEPGEAP